MPHLARTSWVLDPTPHRAPTGSRLRKSRVAPAGMRSSPSGLAWDEASLATNLVEAMPTDAGTPTRRRTSVRIHLPMVTGEPKRRRAPLTSRKASSMLTFSRTGVTSARTDMTWAETSE